MTRTVPAAALALLLVACDSEREDPGLEPTRRSLESLLATLAAGTPGLQVKRKPEAFWEPAGVGTAFLAGDWVQSGPGAFARIEFLGGGRLELDEGALVVIDERAAQEGGEKAEPLLAVETGVIRGVLKEPGQTVGIRAPDGTTARLTPKVGSGPVEYRLSKRQKGTEVAIRKGEATLAAKTTQRELRAGQAAEVEREEVGHVVQLLAPPAAVRPIADALLVVGEGQGVELRWVAVRGAAGYRVQLARREDFLQPLTADTQLTEHAFAASGEGTYYWRAASQDAEGRYGEYGPASAFVVQPPVLDDRLIAPDDGAELVPEKGQGVTVAFRWEDIDAHGYRVVVARGRSLEANRVLDEVTGETETRLELTAGQYVWGVYSVDDEGTRRALFVQPWSLTVAKGAPTVKLPRAIKEWGE